jgi:PhnB protein
MSKQPLIDQLDIAIGRIIADTEVQLESFASMDTAVLELLDVARDLRDLPAPEFKERLRADLERKISMSTKSVLFREGFRTLTPYLLPPNEGYLDFLKNVFDAVQTERTDTGPGRFHAEMRIGDSMLMLGVGSERSMPVMLQIWVPNVEEVYERAIAAGSRSLVEVTEGYGERFGVVEDPGKNQWVISTHLDDDTFSIPTQTLMMWFHPRGAAKFIDFIKRAFNATEVQRHDSTDGRVNYAQMRIGDSVIALNEPSERWMPMQSMVYLYVPDVDALYAQALRAGAKSLSEPKDQFYGDRSAGVQDEWGNMWYIATPL